MSYASKMPTAAGACTHVGARGLSKDMRHTVEAEALKFESRGDSLQQDEDIGAQRTARRVSHVPSLN